MQQPLLSGFMPGAVSMKNRKFTPFPFNESKAMNRTRIGVPGGELYLYDGSMLLRFAGTGLRETLMSVLFRVHAVFFTGLCLLITVFWRNEALRGAVVPFSLNQTFSTLSNFVLTFFIGQVFTKCTARFDNVCKTNGYVTRTSALAAATLSKTDAAAVMRYTNSVLHIYYLLNSGGGMIDKKWDLLKGRGLLTEDEIADLKLQGSPGVVVYSWAIDVIQSAYDADAKASLLGAQLLSSIEECMGSTRGLGAKQIAYSLNQISFIYFQSVFFVVTVSMFWSHVQFAHYCAETWHHTCDADVYSPEGRFSGSCPSKTFVGYVGYLSLVVVYLSLLLTAGNLAESYGDKQYHYDLGNDLDSLWTESQNLLKSMDRRKKKQ
jgi:hypothetical protein